MLLSPQYSSRHIFNHNVGLGFRTPYLLGTWLPQHFEVYGGMERANHMARYMIGMSERAAGTGNFLA